MEPECEPETDVEPCIDRILYNLSELNWNVMHGNSYTYILGYRGMYGNRKTRVPLNVVDFMHFHNLRMLLLSYCLSIGLMTEPEFDQNLSNFRFNNPTFTTFTPSEKVRLFEALEKWGAGYLSTYCNGMFDDIF